MNVDNLTILADWLEANREWIERENRFDMENFTCGTVHCPAGWATHVPEFDTSIVSFSENGYYEFIMKMFSLEKTEYYFLFSNAWVEIDNTLAGAIARIRYLISGNPVGEFPVYYSPERYKSYLPK